MYHRAFQGKYGNSPEVLDSHFAYLKKNYSVIHPDEKAPFFKMNVLLTFDDATADFFFIIFPLLKKYQLKALLAVPAQFISQSHDLCAKERLEPLSSFSFQKKPPPELFCSYEELKLMQESGLVKIASHGFSHADMTIKDLDLSREIQGSKRILEAHLKIIVEDFVLPYGKYSLSVLRVIKKKYKRIYRIGRTVNLYPSPLIARISADTVDEIEVLFKIKNKFMYFFKYIKNFLISLIIIK